MKNLLFIFAFGFILTSCVSSHIGTISSSLNDKPVRYEDVAIGVAQSDIYFGLGGTNQDALLLEAKRELIKNRPLNKNEDYKNFTIDFKTTYYPFYIQRKVTLSADVISFISDTVSNIYSANYKNKFLGNVYSNGLFQIGDTVYNKKLEQGVVISFENTDHVRVLYKTKNDKFRTKTVLIDKIFTKSKEYKGNKPGANYKYDFVEISSGARSFKSAKVIAVGIKSLLVADEQNRTFVEDVKK
jgi:hypothetical protein